MSNTVSQGIFHSTLLCPTAAEYQSKVNSSGIPANTLFQAVTVNQGPSHTQNFLLSTNFCGNNLYVRKRKLAMGRNGRVSGIPLAVLTTDPISELSGKFNLDGDIELQVGVISLAPGSTTKVDIQVSNNSGSLILHWGVICDRQAKWVLPSRCPEGTKVHKNRALRTPFMTTGSGSILKIEIDDPAAQAIEFLILDEAKNKWFKNNGENFHIELRGKERPVQVSIPEDLVQIQAYLRWERNGGV